LHLGWLFPREAGALDGARKGQLSHAFWEALVTNIARVPMDSGQQVELPYVRAYIINAQEISSTTLILHSLFTLSHPLHTFLTSSSFTNPNPKTFTSHPEIHSGCKLLPIPECLEVFPSHLKSYSSKQRSPAPPFSDLYPPCSPQTFFIPHKLPPSFPFSKVYFDW
jgi:hypothetical protein